jgi:translation initiation factor 6 (eIF-6)
MAEVMGVQVAATTIAGQDVVGSLGVTNDQGVFSILTSHLKKFS